MSIRTLADESQEKLLIFKTKLLAGKDLKKLAIVAGVVLLLIIVGGVFLYNRNQLKQDDKAFKEMTALYTKQVDERKPNSAKETIEQYLATNPKNQNYKAFALFNLATVQSDLGDNVEARKTAEESLKLTTTQDYRLYLFLGRTTKLLEDYNAAADYYQKAYDLMQPLLEKQPELGPNAANAKNNVEELRGLANAK